MVYGDISWDLMYLLFNKHRARFLEILRKARAVQAIVCSPRILKRKCQQCFRTNTE